MIGRLSYLVQIFPTKQWLCVFIVVLLCACACSATPVSSGPTHSSSTLVNTTRRIAENKSDDVLKKINNHVNAAGTNNERHEDPTRSYDTNNVTVTPTNVTEGNNTGVDAGDNDSRASVSKLNLAIIPGVAVFVFLVVMCLKGCKWFRQYTRAEDKEAYDHTYNAIVQAGDLDYDLAETRSESTSNNDTISSYFSFLKRSGNESTLSSFRSMKSDNSNDKSSLQAYYDKLSTQGTTGLDASDSSSKLSPLLTDEEKGTVSSAGRGRPTFCTSPCLKSEQSVRTISVSSDDTDLSIVSETDNTTSSKKILRFKVSFVTEAEMRTPKPGTTKTSPMFRSIINNARPTSVSVQAHGDDGIDVLNDTSASDLLKRRYSMNSMRSNSSRKPTVETGMKKSPYYRSNSERIILHSNDMKQELPQMVDVGTQTTKSFRYGLRRGRRKFPSEGGVDENQVPPTIRELSEMCQCKVPNSGDVIGSSSKCRQCDNVKSIDDDVFDSVNVSDESMNSSDDTKTETDANSGYLNKSPEIINHDSENTHTSNDIEAIQHTNCDLFPTNCDRHINGSCHVTDTHGQKRPVDMLFVTQDHITSLHNDSNNIGFCSDKQLPTKQNTENTSTVKPNLRKCHSDLEYSHLHSCGCCYTKVQTLSGTFTYDIKYCRLCSLSGCTISEVVRTNEDESLIGRVGACTNRLKREASLASEDMSSSTTSLSSSGYADMSTGSCSST